MKIAEVHMKKTLGSINRYSVAGLGIFSLIVGAAAAGLLAQPEMKSAGSPEPMETQSSHSAQTPERAMKDWPESARGIARVMIEKYGEPDRISDDALVWYNNGPWQKTVVYREAWPHSVTMRDKDFLEQTIGYQVPHDKVNALWRFDKRLNINQSAGELSSRSESESLNFLALNLADEIVNDYRSVEDARDFYTKTERLAMSGKSSEYLDGFLFKVYNDWSRAPKDVK
jgi:hypothetical protein